MNTKLASNIPLTPEPPDQELRALCVEADPPARGPELLATWEEWETLLRTTDPVRQKIAADWAAHVMELHELTNV